MIIFFSSTVVKLHVSKKKFTISLLKSINNFSTSFLSPYKQVNVLSIDCSLWNTKALFLMIFDHFSNSNFRHKSQSGKLWNLSLHVLPALTPMVLPLSGCCLSTSQLNWHPFWGCRFKNDDLYDLFRKRRWYIPLNILKQVAEIC